MSLRTLTALVVTALLPGVAMAATVQMTVLGRDGQPLPDAVVIIESSAANKIAAPALQGGAVTTTIVQQKMQFVPLISIVPVGSRVRFTNLDNWDHHVRGLPASLGGSGTATGEPQLGFELRVGGRTEGKEPNSADITPDKTGLVQLGCHLHGSMRGYMMVTDSPWAAKTDASGAVSFKDVPEGSARLRVWHPDQLLDTPVTALQVVAVTTATVATQIQPRRRRQ